ncbi:MAG: response regulator [Gammaproteobacteria bacterium]|nr:response regulator [Gammaproteobacteria bacterium]MBV9620390.1 response regulator [Gammaproteobacteria bacterium]
MTSRGLRARLILAVLGVCLVLWVTAIFESVADRRATLQAARRQHENVAGALAEQAARALQATDLILGQAILLDPDAPGAAVSRAQVPDLLQRHMSGVPQVRNLFLFDPARDLHLSSAHVSIDLSDRTYFTAQRDDPSRGLFFSEPFLSRLTGEPTFVLSRRLPGPGFRGIAGAAVEVEYFRRFYHALDLGPGSLIELLRADGTPLVSRDELALPSTAGRWSPSLQLLGGAQARSLVVRLPELGRSDVTLRRVSGYPVLVAVGRSEQAILNGWRHQTWMGVARSVLITALAVLLLLAFLRQLDRHDRVTAQLHQSQKLEALGTFAGGIAHDFNNVLAAVLGYGELAAEQAAPGSVQRRYLDSILIAANRARELVARILSFSRPGTSATAPLRLTELLGEVAELTRASLAPAVTLQTQLADEALVVAGDRAQLHQVFTNLLSNAVQAVGGEGQVELSARRLHCESARDCSVGRLRPGSYACVAVRDHGPGMSAAQAQRIFDPFYTTKAVGQGTGLGLSMVHGIVLDHGAALDVESQPGRGTTFSVYLPLTDQQPASEPAATAGPRGNGEAILVVDDEEALVRLAEDVLASLGYEPVGCTSPNEALRLFNAHPGRFAAVLSDAVMAELPGLELLRRVRRLAPHVPTVLISGYGAILQTEAANAGVDAVLAKPVKSAELAVCLGQLLAGRSHAASTAA